MNNYNKLVISLESHLVTYNPTCMKNIEAFLVLMNGISRFL